MFMGADEAAGKTRPPFSILRLVVVNVIAPPSPAGPSVEGLSAGASPPPSTLAPAAPVVPAPPVAPAAPVVPAPPPPVAPAAPVVPAWPCEEPAVPCPPAVPAEPDAPALAPAAPLPVCDGLELEHA